MTDVKELEGKTCSEVIRSNNNGDDRIEFVCTDGTRYVMYHKQDCCESVDISDIVGDLDFLVGSRILMASEETNSVLTEEQKKERYSPESFTWTFYKFATMKGFVDIRWYGVSNGYYSESVDFEKIS